MQISLNWLKELVAIDVSADELAERLTMLGLEIEAIREPGKEISEIYVGHILDIQPHPDADKLVVCQTDIGRGEPLQIVCGAANMKAGDKVPTAIDGATLPGGFKIANRKMRGIQSCGMMCSARELGLGEDHSGLMILDPDTNVGADIRPVLGLDDVVFEIEVTPNRGDWAGMIGVARELSAYYGLPLRLPEISIRETGEPAAKCSSVTIEDPDLCPRYAGRIARNVVIKPSPPWLCARLIAAGSRPINNVVDITNYVLLETGHPLHAFDYEKLAENRIVARRVRPGEGITTLDGEKRMLDGNMLVIADAKSPQAVAGVMGGADSEVDENTKHVFLESAYFTPRSIRGTAKKLGLLTDAAQNFQRGADADMVLYALNRAAMLMQDLAEAEVAPGILDEYPAKQDRGRVELRYVRSDAMLGVRIDPSRQEAILEGLGFRLIDKQDGKCTVSVPSWRHDVSHESDLIEEIARHYGYDKIPVTMPPVRQSENVFAPQDAKIRELRRFLTAQGATEVLNWSFAGRDSGMRAGLEGSVAAMVLLANPLSENYAGMRTALLPALYGTAAYNCKRGARSIAIFELGPVYQACENETLPKEPVHLGVLLSGATRGQWNTPERPWDFYDIKGCLQAVGNFFRREFILEDTACGAFQAGQSALVKLRKNVLGRIGKVAPAVAREFELPENTYALELDLDLLLARPLPPAQFEDIPQFPPSLRDLAVVVDRGMPAEQVVKAVKDAGGVLLKEVDVFDVYCGKPLPEDKKNIALSLVFQSPERTLTDKDTQKALERIVAAVTKQCGAELR